MSVTIQQVELSTMLPLTGDIGNFKIAGYAITGHLERLYAGMPGEIISRSNFYPSEGLVETMRNSNVDIEVVDCEGKRLLYLNIGEAGKAVTVTADSGCLIIRYPWDLLKLTEKIVGAVNASNLPDDCYKPHVDGFLQLGSGTRILPGVYIEGNVVIGSDCKIGPNCYIRGNTSIGDCCHIGQAVELKNSLIGDKVSVGHLSYIGDSVIADHVNFGAGTICGNLRHDGKNHRSMVAGELVDTGRRKFGMIVGSGVHTGIHTGIYPGRKLGAGTCTLPGEIVKYDTPQQN